MLQLYQLDRHIDGRPAGKVVGVARPAKWSILCSGTNLQFLSRSPPPPCRDAVGCRRGSLPYTARSSDETLPCRLRRSLPTPPVVVVVVAVAIAFTSSLPNRPPIYTGGASAAPAISIYIRLTCMPPPTLPLGPAMVNPSGARRRRGRGGNNWRG